MRYAIIRMRTRASHAGVRSSTFGHLPLRSRKASLAAQGWIHRRLILSGSLAYEKQELGQGVERAQTTFGAGLEWRF